MITGSAQYLRETKRKTNERLLQLSGYRYKSKMQSFRGVSEAQRILDLFLYEQEHFREALGMARKTYNAMNFKEFVNYKPNDEEYTAFAAWDVHDNDLYLLISQAVVDGYKQGSSYNKDNDTYNATYICVDADSPNYGYGLSAFAPTWYDAIRLLVFKHEVLLAGTWLNPDKLVTRSKWG